ncbi:MAG: hypothetical protein ABIG64_03955 [Candidatus Omnitrophota bacterium]
MKPQLIERSEYKLEAELIPQKRKFLSGVEQRIRPAKCGEDSVKAL